MKNRRQHWCSLLVMTCVVTLWATQPGMGLVVSEVMYHPVEEGGTPDGPETLEFIELYNNRAVFEDLTGYAFTNGVTYGFTSGTIIGPKQYLVVARDPAAVEAAYGITGVRGPFTGRLNNDGERIELSNANGEIMISFRYNDGRPWPASPDGTGHSLVLAKLGGDPEEASTWSASPFIGGSPGGPDETDVEPQEPTLVTLVDVGHPGRYFKGIEEPSPGAGGEPTTAWTEITFDDDPDTTPWLDGPSGSGYSNEPEELQWIRTELDDMSGQYISVYARLRFTLTPAQIDSFSQLAAEVHYDDDFVLYLNGEPVAASDGISGDPPPFSAGRGSGTDPSPANVDLTSRMNLLVSGTNVLAIQAHNATISGSSDCISSPILRALTEGGGANDPRGRIVVNELLANSDAPPGTDWLELYNPGPIAVDLSNVYLSEGRFELLQYKIPNGIVLQPGEFWTVREGTPPDGFPFALNHGGETIFLTSATSGAEPEPVRVMDAVRFGVSEADVTLGRYPDGAESFGALTTATYGAANDRPLIRDVVINEIMYHHGTRDERYEYVELYNQGAGAVQLNGWAFTDGIDYDFNEPFEMAPGAYLVVAKDPNLLASVYSNLVIGTNLVGPYSGRLDDHKERIRLSYPYEDPETHDVNMVTVDEVTYYDGGRWPIWADGQGASLELRDPRSNNNAPDAWAASDESGKTTWKQFSFTIDGGDSQYTHDQVTVFGLMLLNRGEVLLDDLELIIDGSSRLTNNGFESGESSWRILGNHVRSFVTTADHHSGSQALHLIATGHGDPGANRINQSITGVTAGTVTFRGWARWLKGSRFLLLRTTRERAPVQPPRPAYAFELDMPLDLGTPGLQNSGFVLNRGPDILGVQHAPVLPADSQPIVVTTTVIDNDGVGPVTLYYRSEGGGFTGTTMVDDGSGDDLIDGDNVFTGTIPGAPGGTMRAFYIEASDGSASTRFPTMLQPSADVPNRTCLVRVGDSVLTTRFATYRIWLSNDVINTFRSRPNLSNELMDCTFVYDDTEVFYNCGLRYRGSPFIRSGCCRDPRDRY
ncbi:MAG: lamin tail domain-containing protein, partial [Phycisphaerales bacterium]